MSPRPPAPAPLVDARYEVGHHPRTPGSRTPPGQPGTDHCTGAGSAAQARRGSVGRRAPDRTPLVTHRCPHRTAARAASPDLAAPHRCSCHPHCCPRCIAGPGRAAPPPAPPALRRCPGHPHRHRLHPPPAPRRRPRCPAGRAAPHCRRASRTAPLLVPPAQAPPPARHCRRRCTTAPARTGPPPVPLPAPPPAPRRRVAGSCAVLCRSGPRVCGPRWPPSTRRTAPRWLRCVGCAASVGPGDCRVVSATVEWFRRVPGRRGLGWLDR